MPTTTLNEAISLAKGKRLVSVREQGKTFWRMMRFLGIADIDYRRMRALIFFSAPSSSGSEAGFVREWERYSTLLFEAKPVTVDGNMAVLAFLQGAIESSSACQGMERYGRLNASLLSAGLWPFRLTNSDQDLALSIYAGDANALLRALEKTPLYDEDYVSSLRPLSQEDVLDWARSAVVGHFSVRKAYLSGSFVFGDVLPDSDVDLCVMFDEGLTEGEKRSCIEGVRGSGLRALGRTVDVKEVLSDEGGNPVCFEIGPGAMEV